MIPSGTAGKRKSAIESKQTQFETGWSKRRNGRNARLTHLSRIEGELIRAFCGAATLLQYQNVQVALGESSEIDLTGYATIASTMLRIGSRLGFRRKLRDVTPDLKTYLATKTAEAEPEAVE